MNTERLIAYVQSLLFWGEGRYSASTRQRLERIENYLITRYNRATREMS